MDRCIHVYTGSGKGKTTAALGLILRFCGSGGSACLIQFDKGAAEGQEVYHERRLFPAIPGLTHHATGLARFDPAKGSFRFKNQPGDEAEAQRGLELARTALGQGYGLLVLDEVLSLVLTGLASKPAIDSLVQAYEDLGRPCELVLTGHTLWPELQAKADLITEMVKQKHYFDAKLKARKGIEF